MPYLQYGARGCLPHTYVADTLLEDSLHLLFPLLASLLFVCGLLFLKRATQGGTNPWTLTLVANVWASLLFSVFWFSSDAPVPWNLLWQPALVSLFYMTGQIGTFWAIQNGDVSIAAPLFGIKVLLVAVMSTLIGGTALPTAIWAAALLATVGIALVQASGSKTGPQSNRSETKEPPSDASHSAAVKKRIWLTIIGASGASLSFAIFDVLVQKFCASPTAIWSKSQFLPFMFWSVGIASVIFIPQFQRSKWQVPEIRRSLILGGLLIALQAMCIIFTISTFGDAARVNVVYSARGVWGVLLAWATAMIWGGSEAHLSQKTMLGRLTGALLITTSVVIAIIFA